MKKIILLCILASLSIITGCNNNSQNKDATNTTKTKLYCYHETYLFHSKKSVEHIILLDKDNKLVDYEYIEKYYDFDDDNDFNMICEGSEEEEENNNKIYPYLKETADCNKESKEVKISDVYYISKLDSKNKLPSTELKESLNKEYILDVNSYKESISKKGYTCEEK